MLSNVSLKSSIRDLTCLVLTTTSSTYASTILPICFFQACMNHALIRRADVFEPEGHCVETEGAVWSDKCRCGLVGLRHINLVVM